MVSTLTKYIRLASCSHCRHKGFALFSSEDRTSETYTAFDTNLQTTTLNCPSIQTSNCTSLTLLNITYHLNLHLPPMVHDRDPKSTIFSGPSLDWSKTYLPFLSSTADALLGFASPMRVPSSSNGKCCVSNSVKQSYYYSRITGGLSPHLTHSSTYLEDCLLVEENSPLRDISGRALVPYNMERITSYACNS